MLFAVFMALYMMVIYPYLLSEAGMQNLATPILIVVFVLSIVLSIFIYRAIVNSILKKIDMEIYFEPLFAKVEKE
jgi:hypothetical protein